MAHMIKMTAIRIVAFIFKFNYINYFIMAQAVPDKHPHTFDEAIWATGGFGKFQKFVTFTITSGFMTGSFIFYGLTFLEDFPVYECKVAQTG